MSILRRGKFGAVLLFGLIFVAVVGGMAWATAASVKLAEKSIEEERRSKRDRALGDVERYIAQVLITEAARPGGHYSATYSEDPLSIRWRDGREFNLNPNIVDVEVPSPLLPLNSSEDWRPYPWIDLYFQIDAHQKLLSPHFPEDLDHLRYYTGVDWRTRVVWRWLEGFLPHYPLTEKIAEARKREWSKESCEMGEQASDARTPDSLNAESKSNSQLPSRSLLSAQAGYIPPEGCVDPRVIARNMPTTPTSTIASGLEDEPGVTTKYSEFAPPFWLEPAPKLAFVRELYADAEVLRQGFVGDWEKLKPELMRLIQTTIPTSELFPEVGGWPANLALNEFRVPALPLILRVPEFALGARNEAWRATRWVLLSSWLGTIAVLMIAGWGVMNLVALTERRMQFAYAVTHELRTPLTTFRLYSDMLSAGLVPEDRKQEYLDTLNRESARLSTMVESVLEYARLENRHARLHLRDTDGTSLLHTVGETLDKRCAENGIEGRKVNEIKNGLRIRTDVDLVSQITGVLINNACRHARSGKAPAVMLKLGGENGKVTVDVVDSGPGVDRADSRRIFKPFRRGRDADKAARGGIGLGLALARNWATLLGGRLDLVYRHDPELGGARFRLTIPSQTTEN